MATTEEMDAMYRWTRYVYDLTRKYYLLGRDRLIDEMELQPGDRVLEIGCGTARNLIRLARQAPRHPLLRTRRLDRDAGHRCGQGQSQPGSRTGSRSSTAWPRISTTKKPSSSTRPSRHGLLLLLALDDPHLAAGRRRRPGQHQARRGLPRRRFLGPGLVAAAGSAGCSSRWLDLFHVHYRPELLEYLRDLDAKHVGMLTRALRRRSLRLPRHLPEVVDARARVDFPNLTAIIKVWP